MNDMTGRIEEYRTEVLEGLYTIRKKLLGAFDGSMPKELEAPLGTLEAIRRNTLDPEYAFSWRLMDSARHDDAPRVEEQILQVATAYKRNDLKLLAGEAMIACMKVGSLGSLIREAQEDAA